MSKQQPQKQIVMALDPMVMAQVREQEELEKSKEGPKRDLTILESIVKSLKNDEIKRMSFESDPLNSINSYGSLYRLKNNLTPDHIIKKLIGPQGDDLLCAIIQARANLMASFGRPRTSRFAIGFEFQPINSSSQEELSPESREEEKKRLDALKEVIWNCGSKEVDDEYFHPNFSQFLKLITRDGVGYGRFAVEFLMKPDPRGGKDKLYAWRAVDGGTIYRVIPKKEADQGTRQTGLRLLAELKNEKIDPLRYAEDAYKYVQVIDGRPMMAFSDKELVVYNLYPVTNVEYNGYPMTPIDQALNAIITHINITLHNRLYFQNGRASRGMLVFQSDEVDESAIQKIRLQFHQSINSVQNSWRMPVFGIGTEDKLTWESIDVSGRDAEFQYLSDQNARVILSAFQMSPEELPGYAHLARGTNTQALSETDNEYKLEAGRDVGLRPLMYDIQDFFNTHILPKLDEEISKKYQLVFAGLEKDSPEKESTRIQQDMLVHLTMNDIQAKVEKKKLPKGMGGDMPFNPQYQQILNAYLTQGQIMEFFFGIKDATNDPREQYKRDPFWMQWQQILLQKAQLAMQTQMAQRQAEQAQQQAAMGAPPQEEQAPPGASDEQKSEVAELNLKKREEWLAKNWSLLDSQIKDNHNNISKMLLKRHKEMVESNLNKWKQESQATIEKLRGAIGKKK
jgi:hypothetical protein